jgi:hypothetical protein
MEKEKLLDWYKSERMKDELELNQEKKKLIEQIKGIKKGDIIIEPEKLSLWKRIKRVLGF